MRNKIISLLVLLLTAVTGAWAGGLEGRTFVDFKIEFRENPYMVILPANGELPNGVLVDGTTYNGSQHGVKGGTITVPVDGPVKFTIGACQYSQNEIVVKKDGEAFTTVNNRATCGESTGSFAKNVTYVYNGKAATLTFEFIGNTFIPYFFAEAVEESIEVTWDAKTKTGTFVMPAFDVEIAPIYAPVAQWAKVENVDQLPTAIEGIFAESTDAIVKAGTVAKVGSTENAQGTLMYLVTTENKKPTSTTGFSATVPTGAALTGSFAEDQTVYVWYYIAGIDAAEGVTPTEDNTFNDSEICATPLTVKLKANQFTLTLDPAPVKNITVTAGTETKTPTTEGKTDIKMNSEVKLKANEGYKFRKVEVKKGAADVKIESFSIQSSKNTVSSSDTFTCSIIDILPANATNQTFEWKINSGAPAGTTIKTVSDDTKTVTIQAGANSGSITIEATAKDGGGANKSKDIMVKE